MGIEINIDLTSGEKILVSALLRRYLPNVEVWAYGSRARWNARPDSDLDLVAFAKPEDMTSIYALKEAFEQSNLPFRVDFFVWDKIPETFHKAIKKEKVVVQAIPDKKVEGGGMSFEFEILENSKIQLIDGDRGKNYPNQSDFKEKDYCLFLSAKNVTLLGFKFSDTSFITEEKDNILRSGKLQRGDIIVTTRGTIGNVAFYSDAVPFDNIRINSGMMIFRASESKWNRRFLYFLLTSNFIKQQIKSLTSGSAVPQLPARDLNKFSLPKIPLKIQNSIEKIIGDIDDKIENNRKINETLEGMAQAVFKSWFVDFEPTRAKMAALKKGGSEQDVTLAAMNSISGKPLGELELMRSTSPEAYKELKSTATLFPASLQDSELGKIPTGWEVVNVSDFGNVVCGKTPSKKKEEYYAEDVPFIKIPDMHGNMFILNTKEMLSNEGSNSQIKKLIPQGSICVSCIATVGKVSITSKPSHTNQQINSIVPSKNYCTPYLYFKFKSLNGLLHDMASGGSTTLNLNTGYFSTIKIIKPNKEILFNFFVKLEPVLNLILENAKQSQTLTQTRDALLPKLLSGEIDVSSIRGDS